jgi:nucleotide-binding universal stress UspA family protein
MSRRTGERGAVFGRRLNGTIVCVLDHPAGAQAALHVARRLTERFDARILLVGVIDGPWMEGGGAAADAAAAATRAVRRLAAEHLVADEDQRIAAGDPAEAVARIAAEEAGDLIVVGARRGLRPRTMQSILARDLAATASCPVVVAPPRAPDRGGDPIHLRLGAR